MFTLEYTELLIMNYLFLLSILEYIYCQKMGRGTRHMHQPMCKKINTINKYREYLV